MLLVSKLVKIINYLYAIHSCNKSSPRELIFWDVWDHAETFVSVVITSTKVSPMLIIGFTRLYLIKTSLMFLMSSCSYNLM
jgi:hypothetical protein